MRKIKSILERSKYFLSFINYDLFKICMGFSKNEVMEPIKHLDAAAKWLCHAQDVFEDGGVARSFCLVYHRYFGRRGWIASYPETTGYIIPTMFDYAQFSQNQEFFDRAVRMADWECDVQMENGAVQGGTIDQKPTPAIFNTGQVIFGWLRAFEETQNGKYLNSAIRAGEFLIKSQDEDGAWRKNLSDYASGQMSFYTYNTRTAWALCLLSSYAGVQTYKDASISNIEFALGQQLENGWFKNNCLHNPKQPLLHTIAYCIRGILEIGVLLNNEYYINRAKKAAEALIEKQGQEGKLSGRFDNTWQPTVPWSCLTGCAQISIIWSRLFQITGEPKYFECTKKINRYLMKCQLVRNSNRNLFGGITGSDPIQSVYGHFEILNWGVKFFIDALLLEISIQDNNI